MVIKIHHTSSNYQRWIFQRGVISIETTTMNNLFTVSLTLDVARIRFPFQIFLHAEFSTMEKDATSYITLISGLDISRKYFISIRNDSSEITQYVEKHGTLNCASN